MADEANKRPHPVHEDRWEDGTQRPGFPGPARKHGLYSFEAHGQVALPDDLRVSVEDFRNEIVSDLGGTEELTAIAKGYVRGLVDMETCRRLLQADIVKRGLVTPKGRVRGIYTKLLETMDRWDRYAQRLGTERRSRSVQSLREYLAQSSSEDPA